MLRDEETLKLHGKLSLMDLAGSERGGDTKSHNAQRRTESSKINTSLLALKALDGNKANQRVPYCTSKLTLILKDCFTSE
jgi:kinesin family protein 2/24